jgi:hypothetical protein
MSFDKAIRYGKEHRKPYIGGSAKDVDPSCRNHGDCPACRRMRQRRNRLAEYDAEEQMKDIYADKNDDPD